MTGEIPIVLLSVWNLESYVHGHHVYKDVWTPTIGETLLCKMEPNIIKDNYAVCVQKDGVIVGHLMLGKTGRCVKIIFYFLRGYTDSKCEVITTGKQVNLGDNKGMQVLCELQFVGKDKRICLLKKELVG